jgi:hypothetical protein
LSIQIQDADGKPLSECEVEISPNTAGKAGEEKTVLKTDHQGQVTVPVTGDRLSNYHLKLPEGAIAKVTTSPAQVKTVASSNESVPAPEDSKSMIDLAEYELLDPDGVRIYFPKGQEELAGQTRLELQRMRELAKKQFHLDLVGSGFGLILTPRSLEKGGKLEVNEVLIPLPILAWTDEKSDLYSRWVLLHEWVEITMLAAGVHSKDQALRFAADGLSELVASEYCRVHRPDDYNGRIRDYLKTLRRLEEKKIEVYRFEDSFRIQSNNKADPAADLGALNPSDEEVAGYACSFWLWSRLQTKGGEEKLHAAVNYLMSHGSPTADGLVELMEQHGYHLPREARIEEVIKDLQTLLIRYPT